MSNKLTICERHASNMCQDARTYGSITINVEWKRSAMYGYNPVIEWGDGKACNVPGCGYDKLSAALAYVLRFIGDTPEQRASIRRCSGAGVSSVEHALFSCGWRLTRTASGKSFDAFHLSRIEPAPVVP